MAPTELLSEQVVSLLEPFISPAGSVDCMHSKLVLKKWGTESFSSYILNNLSQICCLKMKKASQMMENLECRKFSFMSVKC